MKALLVYNRSSGHRDRTAELTAAAERLAVAGWAVEMAAAGHVAEMEQLARSAVAADHDALIVAGGDGTINVALQALAHSRTALGVIPTGTANVWTREMGIPSDVRGATEVLLAGRVARVDLGQANGRYFLMLTSVGFDALVTQAVNPGSKRRLGMLAYLVAAAVESFKLQGVETLIAADGHFRRQRVLMLVVNNIRLYGGVVNMAPEALADDGLLDVLVFPGSGRLEALRHLFMVLLGRHTRDPEATFFRTSALTIEARNLMPVELDGDYFGTTPVTIRVAPGALRAIVPPGPHPQLGAGDG